MCEYIYIWMYKNTLKILENLNLWYIYIVQTGKKCEKIACENFPCLFLLQPSSSRQPLSSSLSHLQGALCVTYMYVCMCVYTYM